MFCGECNYKYLHVDYEVVDNRINLIKAPREMQEALEQMPDIKERMILAWNKKQLERKPNEEQIGQVEINDAEQDSVEPISTVKEKERIDYHRGKGETLERYLQRYHADLFLNSIIDSGVTEERAIIEQSKIAYLEMAKVGKYYNLPEVKSQRERILAILDGALLFEN